MDNAYSAAGKGRPVETSITQGLPPSRLGNTGVELPDLRSQSPRRRSEWVATAILLSVHVLVGVGLLYTLLSVVPRFKKTFFDFSMKLPFATAMVIDVSDIMLEFRLLLPFALAALLVSDGAALFLLRRQERTRILARLWFYLILLLLLSSLLFSVAACLGPLLELTDALSR